MKFMAQNAAQSLLLSEVVFLFLQTASIEKGFCFIFSFRSCGFSVMHSVVEIASTINLFPNSVYSNQEDLKFYLLCLVQREPLTSHRDSDLTRGFVTVTRTCLVASLTGIC